MKWSLETALTIPSNLLKKEILLLSLYQNPSGFLGAPDFRNDAAPHSAAGVIPKYLIHSALKDNAVISTVHVACSDCKGAFQRLY